METVQSPEEEKSEHFDILGLKQMLNQQRITVPYKGMEKRLHYQAYEMPNDLEEDALPYPNMDSFLQKNPYPRRKDKNKKNKRKGKFSPSVRQKQQGEEEAWHPSGFNGPKIAISMDNKITAGEGRTRVF